MINKNSSHPEPRPLPLGRAPEGFYPGSNQMVSGARRSIKAFTLIELLVVVLIIGILAAVAVPMYKRAVLKSQFSTLMPLAKNLWEGNEVFYLNNGEYAASVDELDVSAPVDPKVQATLGDEEHHQYVRISKTDVPNRITMYQKHSPNFPGETHCEALQDNEQANWLCKDGLQGTFVGNKFGYAVYSLSPESTGSLARTYYNIENGAFADGDICIANRARGCSQYSQTTHVKFERGAICVGGGSWSCLGPFDNSYCIGDMGPYNTSCNGQYKNYSVCYAKKANTCNGSYDETSCCTGNYCPTETDTCAYKGITPPPQPTY